MRAAIKKQTKNIENVRQVAQHEKIYISLKFVQPSLNFKSCLKDLYPHIPQPMCSAIRNENKAAIEENGDNPILPRIKNYLYIYIYMNT